MCTYIKVHIISYYILPHTHTHIHARTHGLTHTYTREESYLGERKMTFRNFFCYNKNCQYKN